MTTTLAASAIPGATALPTDLLRPYRGLGIIYSSWGRFWQQYDSIQTSYNRRFSHGWQAGLNWTWSLRSIGNTSSPLHFIHNADGTISDDPHQPMPWVLDGCAWDEWSKKERTPICHGDRCSDSHGGVLIWRASPEQPECDG